MATIDDVEQGVCNALAAVMFPGQAYLALAVATCSAPWIGSPGAPPLTIQARLGIAEPASAEMEADLAAAISNVIVARISGAVRNAATFRPRWIQTSFNTPTLLAAITDGAVTFGGLAGPGMVAGVVAGNVCYAYRPVAGDTPATVAAAFAGMIPGALAETAVLSGPDITAVQVVADQTAFWATGQKETLVQVIIIATPSTPNGIDGPLVRSAITRLVYGLEAMERPNGTLTRFIGLPDGTMAQVYSFNEADDDAPALSNMWKRTITFRIVYDVGVSQTQFSVLAPLLLAGSAASRIFWAGNAAPVSGVLTDGAGNVIGDASGDILGIL